MTDNRDSLTTEINDIIDMFFAQKQLYARANGTYVPPTTARVYSVEYMYEDNGGSI